MTAFLRLFQTDPGPRLEGQTVFLRLPRLHDYKPWAELRAQSAAFLQPWEPTWPEDDLTRQAFRARLNAYARALEVGEAFPFFMFRRDNGTLIGGVRLFHIRRGVAQSGVMGYWIGDRLRVRRTGPTSAGGRLHAGKRTFGRRPAEIGLPGRGIRPRLSEN